MRHPRKHEPRDGGKERSAVVLDVRGMVRAAQQSTVAAVLGRRPGVLDVEVNAVAQSAAVVFDPAGPPWPSWAAGSPSAATTVRASRCRPTSCDPMDERDPPGAAEAARAVPPAHAGHASERGLSPEGESGHGGHDSHAGMSMAAMVADMRNRFLVAVVHPAGHVGRERAGSPRPAHGPATGPRVRAGQPSFCHGWLPRLTPGTESRGRDWWCWASHLPAEPVRLPATALAHRARHRASTRVSTAASEPGEGRAFGGCRGRGCGAHSHRAVPECDVPPHTPPTCGLLRCGHTNRPRRHRKWCT